MPLVVTIYKTHDADAILGTIQGEIKVYEPHPTFKHREIGGIDKITAISKSSQSVVDIDYGRYSQLGSYRGRLAVSFSIQESVSEHPQGIDRLTTLAYEYLVRITEEHTHISTPITN